MENEDIEQKIKLSFETNADETGKEVNALSGAVNKVTESQQVNNTENKKTEASYKSMKTQVREAMQDLMKISQVYGETSKEAVAAAKKVAQLKDQMQFSKDLVDQFNPDQKFKALGAATQIAATATSGLVSGMALFGDQSKDTEKALLKVQAAMAFSESISGLSNLGDQWQVLKTVVGSSTIVTSANTAATAVSSVVMNLFGVSVNTTSKSFKLLKGAIIGTGIGALVIGLVMLVQNFDAVKKAVLNVVPGLSGISNTIGNIVNSITDFIGVTSEVGRATDKLKANADASLSLNKKFLAEHGSQLDEFTKQKLAAKDKYSNAIKEDGANQKALAAELNRELAAIEYSRGDDERKIQKENAEKAADLAKQNREKAAKEAKDAADKKAKEQQERITREAEAARSEYEAAEKIISDAKKANEDSLKTENDLKVEQENADFEIKKAQLIKAKLSIEEIEKEHKRNIAALNDEYYAGEADKAIKKAADEKEIDQRILEQKQALHDAKMKLEENAFSFLKSIAGKNKLLQKGLIIAESALGIGRSIISMNAANVAATAEGAALAIPTAGVSVATAAGIVTANTISAGIGVAANIAATSKALSALGGGGSASGGSQSSGGGRVSAGSATPQVNFQASKENQIGNTIAGKLNEQAPVRVTVLENDITKAQTNILAKVVSNSF